MSAKAEALRASAAPARLDMFTLRAKLAVGAALAAPWRWSGQFTSEDRLPDELTTLAEEMTGFFLARDEDPAPYYLVYVAVEGRSGDYADIWKRSFEAADLEGVLVELESYADHLEREGMFPKTPRQTRGPTRPERKRRFGARLTAEEAARKEGEGG